jgi:pilus assembly protein CpaC
MKVKHKTVELRRRVFSSVLISILLCNAAPVALAQVTATGIEGTSSISGGVLEMYQGEVRILRLPGTIKRIANGKLVTTNMVDGRLMLLAEGAGVTSLVVWNEKGIALQTTLRIAKGDVTASAEQLRSVLRSVSGLHIDSIGPNIVLSGAVHSDMVPLIQTATADLKNVINTTTVDAGDALKKTVHFKVQIMEISRTGQENLGIAWDSQVAGPQIGGQAYAGTGASSIASVVGAGNYFLAGIASNITSKINMAINDGEAYILAAPELNTKSGGTATFLAGGEVPIPRAGALGTTDVEYKPYGIKLNIKPVVDANNIISANLLTEISQIDPSVTYGGFPGFLTRRTSSDISLRAGETLAISGLISADSLNAVNRVPYLSKVPIIGQLFSSTSFRSKKSDLVIFVTPLISDPALSPNTDMLARADKFDNKYRSINGNPSPLAEAEYAESTPATRHPIGPTPAVRPTPTRSMPQAPDSPPASNVPVEPTIGVAEAIRMLDAARKAQDAPRTSSPTPPVQRSSDAAPSAPSPAGVTPNAPPEAEQSGTFGKLPPHQIDVIGNSGN